MVVELFDEISTSLRMEVSLLYSLEMMVGNGACNFAIVEWSSTIVPPGVVVVSVFSIGVFIVSLVVVTVDVDNIVSVVVFVDSVVWSKVIPFASIDDDEVDGSSGVGDDDDGDGADSDNDDGDDGEKVSVFPEFCLSSKNAVGRVNSTVDNVDGTIFEVSVGPFTFVDVTIVLYLKCSNLIGKSLKEIKNFK